MQRRARGRPRGFDAEATLRLIADRFRDGGFSATSLDDIARATGLNRPSLYAAYGDKKAMYVAVLDRLLEDVATSIDALEAAGLGLRDTVTILFAQSIAGYLAGPHGPRGCLAIGTASAEAVGDPDIRAVLDGLLKLIDARVTRWFERADVDNGAGRARLLASTLHSLSIRARAGQPRETLEAIAADAIELLVPR